MATTKTDDDSSTVDSDSTDDRGGLTRDPSCYIPTDHFVIRAKLDHGPRSETRTAPPITADVIATCITEGEIVRARDGCVKFIAEVPEDGTEWHLVTHGRKVLTAYAPAHHTECGEFREGGA